MSALNELTGRLVFSFLTLDDLVLGQSLASESGSQFDRLGKTTAGTAVLGANLAARGVHLGIQAGAKTAGVAAGLVEGLVPGAGMVRRAAEHLDESSREAGSRAAQLGAWAMHMAGGPEHTPRDPITGTPWLSAGAPEGYTWRELAADTALGPWARVAGGPLSVALGVATRTASTDMGQKSVSGAVQLLGKLREMVDGGHASERLDPSEVREHLLTLAAGSGGTALHEITALAEASARLAFGDPRRLHDSMQDVLDSLRAVVAVDHVENLLPAAPISDLLQERAREVLDNAPEAFLAALAGNGDGKARPDAILLAMVEDAARLRTFLVQTPQILTLMGMNAGLALSGGLADAEMVEAWLNAQEPDEDHERSQPWSLRLFEELAGRAQIHEGRRTTAGMTGMLSAAAVEFGQDAAYLSVCEVLGPDEALHRAESLHGAKVRARLENDPSLDRALLDLSRPALHAALRDRLAKLDVDAVVRVRNLCAARLESLRSLASTMYDYRPRQVARRIEILDLYLVLIAHDLALDRTDSAARGSQADALQALESWAS